MRWSSRPVGLLQQENKPGSRTPADSEVTKRPGLIATDVISDDTEALLASKELDACGYTDNAFLAQHLKRFLEIVIEYNH